MVVQQMYIHSVDIYDRLIDWNVPRYFTFTLGVYEACHSSL
jgi:hypothetical protein